MAGTIVSGKLVNAAVKDFSNDRVNADYLMGGVPTRQSAAAVSDGTFAINLPDAGTWTGPLSLSVTGLSGVTLGSVDGLKAEGKLTDIDIAVAADTDPVVITTSDDPTLGTVARFSGRVITSAGEG